MRAGWKWAIDHRAVTVAPAAVILAIALGSLFFIGTEFMPQLDEGSILVETRKLPGVSLTDSVEISKRIEQRLRAFPEIADVVIKIGRPDFATEAMGINEGDTYLLLRPMNTWKRFHTKEDLIAALDKELSQHPRHRLQLHAAHGDAHRRNHFRREGRSGRSRSSATTFRTLDALGQQVLRSISTVRGAADAQMEVTSGVAELSVHVDRAALARYGLNVTDVEEAVAAGGSGEVISEVIDGQKRYTRGSSPARPLSHRSRRDARHSAARAGRRAGHARSGGADSKSRAARKKSSAKRASGASSSCRTSAAETWAVLLPRFVPSLIAT